MGLNSLYCAYVPLSNYSLTHSSFLQPLRLPNRGRGIAAFTSAHWPSVGVNGGELGGTRLTEVHLENGH